MSIGSILSWMVCGLVVGICARFLVPGRQYMSLLMTALLGIGGALLGGFLYSVIRGRQSAVLIGQPQLVRMDRRDTGRDAAGVGVSRRPSQKMVELIRCVPTRAEQIEAESQTPRNNGTRRIRFCRLVTGQAEGVNR